MDTIDGQSPNQLFAGSGFGVTVKEKPGLVTFEGHALSVSRQIEEWIKLHPHCKVGVAKASFLGKHNVHQTVEYVEEYTEKKSE